MYFLQQLASKLRAPSLPPSHEPCCLYSSSNLTSATILTCVCSLRQRPSSADVGHGAGLQHLRRHTRKGLETGAGGGRSRMWDAMQAVSVNFSFRRRCSSSDDVLYCCRPRKQLLENPYERRQPGEVPATTAAPHLKCYVILPRPIRGQHRVAILEAAGWQWTMCKHNA